MVCRSYYVFLVPEAYEKCNQLALHKVSHRDSQRVPGEAGFPLLYISSPGDDPSSPCHSTNTGECLEENSGAHTGANQ